MINELLYNAKIDPNIEQYPNYQRIMANGPIKGGRWACYEECITNTNFINQANK